MTSKHLIKTGKLPFYFSVDFEDFYYDTNRRLGNPYPTFKLEAVKKSYEIVNKYSEQFFEGRRITFFVTAVLARKAPDLIQRIFNDGHEIACHYNFHDNVDNATRETFGENLDIAIETLHSITGEWPVGFRAPNFAISAKNTYAYEELAKRFKYDSSYKTSELASKITKNREFIFGDNSIKEFCVYGMPYAFGKINIRSGGTFLRLFPVSQTIMVMEQAYDKQHAPILYLHPYEILTEKEFWLTWADLKFMSIKQRTFFWLRQNQWSNLGNKTVERKIEQICKIFEHQGPMRELLAE
ncbi:polysaccharide deacetylase family protein [Amylibacter sp.]|nr:polysaccharide deacetylase family protein [Amylibacter sp.]MDC1414107.1 polysaccharide deacetylase family protein [Amylibacter sp.]